MVPRVLNNKNKKTMKKKESHIKEDGTPNKADPSRMEENEKL